MLGHLRVKCNVALLLVASSIRISCEPSEQCDGAACEGDRETAMYGNNHCDDLVQYSPLFDREPQSWQVVSGRPIWVFSAFVERRTNANGPSVRIVASGLQRSYNDIGDLHCVLWYDINGEVFPVTHEAEYIRIYPSTMHHDMWVAHFIICPVVVYDMKDHTPFAVSVTPEPCDKPENYLLVKNRNMPLKMPTHGLCLPPVYMKFPDWQMVIEMIEVHKLLGVSEIAIYNQSASPLVDYVLDTYANDPSFKVNVIQWHFPGHLVTNNVNCQRGAINDCMYRMSNEHQYVSVNDLDEILVPRCANTLPELMNTVAAPSRGIYMFQHAYFRRNITGQTPYLITQQSLWRTDKVIPAGKIRCKSMYNTDLAISTDLHYHYQLVYGAEEYMMPPEEGMLHHYRSTPMTTFMNHPERFSYIEDTYMHKYGQVLTRKVAGVMARMNFDQN